MRRGHLGKTILVAGILGVALGGCGSENNPGTLGSSGGTNNAGGAAAGGGSGGTASSGGVVAGGTSGSGGSVGSGGAPGTGGSLVKGTGGAPGTGGAVGTGGRSSGTGGSVTPGTGGTVGKGGANSGGATSAMGGAEAGRTGAGGRGTGGVASGGGTLAAGGSGAGGRTSTPGTCTPSKAASVNATGSGPHKVVVESNSDSAMSCGTIYRPADLGGATKYPIFVWGEGACTRSGTSNTAAMGEIASYGYFVIADGPPSGGGNCASIGMSTDVVPMGKPLVGYIGWAIAENDKSCSAYYQSLDTTKIASDGFSCGGLMSYGTAADPRMTAVGITSSGMTSAVASFYKSIHTPVKILVGGSGDIAYTNGERDYDQIAALGTPVVLFSKNGAGHGGDLGAKNGGDFTKVNLAWLNWQLKGDTGATGKGFLVGDTCTFCKDSAWETKSKNLP
jgi:hypothetical protein